MGVEPIDLSLKSHSDTSLNIRRQLQSVDLTSEETFTESPLDLRATSIDKLEVSQPITDHSQFFPPARGLQNISAPLSINQSPTGQKPGKKFQTITSIMEKNQRLEGPL